MNCTTGEVNQSYREVLFTGQPAGLCSTNKAKSWVEGYFTFDSPRESIPDRRELANPSIHALSHSQPLSTSSSEQQKRGKAIMAALTGDSNGSNKLRNTPKRGLSSWFGTTPLITSNSDVQSTPRTCTTHLHHLDSSLSTSLGSLKTITSSSDPLDHDLSSFKVIDALFPESGRPDNQDPYSPSAFNDLLTNAEKLLTRLQTAYVQHTHALREMSSSRDSLADELDEANTRADSLRSQLEIMAQQGTVQDQRIADLERELLQARSYHFATISNAKQNSLSHTSSPSPDLSCMSQSHLGTHHNINLSNLNEDPCHNSDGTRQSWRSSYASPQLSSDFDVSDSDAESGAADSIFSRPRSPAPTMRSTTTSVTSEEALPITPRFLPFSLTAKHGASRVRPLWSGLKTSTTRDLESSCANCRGKHADLAWDAVELLRAENTGLKEQIVTLQEGVDDALAAIMCRP